jgi:hypothetical protein
MASPDETTFRQERVQQRLEDHDTRISRLEKAGLMVVGYGLAEGAQIIDALTSLL